VVIAALAIAAAAGCGGSHITPDRIERAIEPTFANLVQLQVSRLALRPMAASELDVIASCRKSTAGRDAGAGEWICKIVWLGPDRQTLRDTFGLYVTTDGCYTATAEGNSLGGPTLEAGDGRAVRNLLYAFEGCFDPT
jgi:ABC-2 type transport system permease protein